jgi:hypothetical protein
VNPLVKGVIIGIDGISILILGKCRENTLPPEYIKALFYSTLNACSKVNKNCGKPHNALPIVLAR